MSSSEASRATAHRTACSQRVRAARSAQDVTGRAAAAQTHRQALHTGLARRRGRTRPRPPCRAQRTHARGVQARAPCRPGWRTSATVQAGLSCARPKFFGFCGGGFQRSSWCALSAACARHVRRSRAGYESYGLYIASIACDCAAALCSAASIDPRNKASCSRIVRHVSPVHVYIKAARRSTFR